MQCSRCGAVAPHGAAIYCYSCGEPLLERTGEASSAPAGGAQTNELVEPDSPVTSTPVEHDATVQAAPLPVPASEEFGWVEYGGISLSQGERGGTRSVEPLVSQFPSVAQTPPLTQFPPIAVSPISIYTPYTMPSGFGVPVKRGSRHPGLWFLLSIALCFLVVLLIFSVVFIYVYPYIGQMNGVTSLSASDRAALQAKADQVYKQVMSQSPLYGESLQSVAPGGWSDHKQAIGGCEIKNDGYHVHTNQANGYFYCNSGHGSFDNFALQVDMKMVTGNGGLIIRCDQDGANFYYFNIAPDGQYNIQIKKKNNWVQLLDIGSSTSLSTDFVGINTLTVIAQGNQLYFYVNKVFLTGVHDSSFSIGELGLMAAGATVRAEVVYTNAKIWEL